MAKPPRNIVKKSKSDLLDDLAEQIELLVSYCQLFDNGTISMAKPMSAALKVLLYGAQGNSLSLLHQLGLRQRRFVDTSPGIKERSSFPQCQLAAILVDDVAGNATYVPMLSSVPGKLDRSEFAIWWNAAVVRDSRGHTFSRMSIVQEVRDTDGGAHLDQGLEENYLHFKSGRYMGWQLRKDGNLTKIPHPHSACIRQIAHETLLSLQEIASTEFRSEYHFASEPFLGRNGVVLFNTQVSGNPGQLVPMIRVGNLELIGEVSPNLASPHPKT